MTTIKAIEYRAQKKALMQLQLELNKMISDQVETLEAWAMDEEKSHIDGQLVKGAGEEQS